MGSGANTKEKILEVALDMFADCGYEGARMEKIASAVGINKASLYFHFKSKEEIFHELFHNILKKYSLKIKEIFSDTAALPMKQRLIAIYKQYLEFNWDNVEMDFWNRVYYFPPDMMREEVIRLTFEAEGEFLSQLIATFEEGVRNKEIQPLEPAAMAKTYYYLLTCIGLSVDLIKQPEAIQEMEKCFIIFWGGIV